MSAPMHEVTLDDLLAWEPRFEWAGEPPAGWRGRAVNWVVVARASAPMLPLLHGGEIVILPRVGLEASGSSLANLLRDLAPHHPAAVVVEPATEPDRDAAGAGVPLLALPGATLTSELESRLNRLLAERRGDLYRAGTELGRALTAVAGRDPDLARVIQVAAEATGLPLRVCDAAGRLIARGPGADENLAPGCGAGIERPLAGGCRLVIGPVPADRRAMARLVADRIVIALNDVLTRAADRRPRGAGRPQALAALLDAGDGGAPVAIEARARQLALPVDGTYRVALIRSDAPLAAAPPWLRLAGTVHSAGRLADADAFLLECRDRKGKLGAERDAAPAALVAVSAPAFGAAAVPDAARQARFIVQLLAAGSLPGPVARFDRPEDLHAYRLLYALWGSPAAGRYARDLLGELPSRDRRGELRKTLLALLDAGGSQVEAARRLGIHRNTLAYRLRQIDRTLGRDLSDAHALLGLHLALLIDDLPIVDDGRVVQTEAAAGGWEQDWRADD